MLLALSVFSGSAYSQSATVEGVWIEHGVQSGGETGMRIHAKVIINGMKGKKARVYAFFYDENKKFLKGGVSGYLTTNNSPYVGETVTLPYESTLWEDFRLFMPVRAIPLAPGKKTYYVAIYVKEDAYDGKWLGNSTYFSFTGTGSQQSVVQKETPSGTGKYGKRVGTFYFKNGNGALESLTMNLEDGVYYAKTKFSGFYVLAGGCDRLYKEDSQNFYFRMAEVNVTLNNLNEYYSSGGRIPIEPRKIFTDIGGTSLIIAKDWSKITFVGRGLLTGTDLILTTEISKEEYEKLKREQRAAILEYEMRGNFPTNTGNNTSTESQSSSPRQEYVNCKGCGGSGKCTGCAGRGWYKYTVYVDNCAVCNGTGRCGVCYGRGTIRL